jgi:hypothetical protein
MNPNERSAHRADVFDERPLARDDETRVTSRHGRVLDPNICVERTPDRDCPSHDSVNVADARSTEDGEIGHQRSLAVVGRGQEGRCCRALVHVVL